VPLAESPQAPKASSGALPSAGGGLLERDSELDLVSRALRSAHHGEGALLVISGPLGGGKSKLLRALPALAGEDTRVLTASASALERDYAFGVVRQLLGAPLHGACDEQRRRWLSGAAGLADMVFADDSFDAEDGAVAVRQAVSLGLQAFAERLSAEQTLLVLVDDLQWTDEPSLQWLAHLANRVNRLRVLVVATVREGDLAATTPAVRAVTRAAAHVLRPRPFSLAATRALIAARCGEPGDDEFVLACHETTDGNPMFLGAILLTLSVGRLVAGDRVPPRAEHADRVRSLRPAQLRDRIIDCLRGQPESLQSFARAVATLDGQADLEIIGRLAGVDGVGCDEVMRVLRGLGLLTGSRQPRFSHAVVQDAVEESMTVAERERLHVQAVHLLHGSGYTAEQVAAQLLAISSPQGRWATEVLRAAAGTALRRGAPEVAARYLRRALLDTAPDGEDRARLLVDLATVERQFDMRTSIRHITHALPLLSSARDRAGAVVRLAPALLGDASPVIRALIRQVYNDLGDLGDAGELTGADRELTLRLEARVRHLDYNDPAELADALRRLDGLGAEPPVDTPAERELLAMLLFAATLTTRHRAASVASVAERILEREPASPAHVHTSLPMLVTTLVGAESTERLVPWLEMCHEHASRQGAVIEQALIRTEQALVTLHQGRLADARRAATDALELGALDWHTASSPTVIALAGVATATGDVDLARTVLAGCRDETNECLVSVPHMLRGSMAMAARDFRAALEHFQEFGRQTVRSGWRNPVLVPWRALTADLHRRLGDLDAAREVAEEDCCRSAEWGAPSALGRAKRVLGDVIEGDAGILVLRESVEVLESSINRVELARSLLHLGTRLRDRGDPEAAEHLRRCHQLALDLDDQRIAEQAGTDVNGGNGHLALTKAELRVARLAAEGHANHDIAEFLGVTRRAVEKHLTSSYRKLGVRRRAELVRVVPPIEDGG
jgi:DNA-binding CsgD family transcriptional regulator